MTPSQITPKNHICPYGLVHYECIYKIYLALSTLQVSVITKSYFSAENLIAIDRCGMTRHTCWLISYTNFVTYQMCRMNQLIYKRQLKSTFVNAIFLLSVGTTSNFRLLVSRNTKLYLHIYILRIFVSSFLCARICAFKVVDFVLHTAKINLSLVQQASKPWSVVFKLDVKCTALYWYACVEAVW